MKELNRVELEQCLRKMTEMTDEELNRVAGGSEAIDRTENAIRETLKNGCLIPGMFEYMMEALEKQIPKDMEYLNMILLCFPVNLIHPTCHISLMLK